MRQFTNKLLILAIASGLALTSCGGGATDETRAVEAAAVELDWTASELEDFDKDNQPELVGKVVEIEATVIRSGSSHSSEVHLGDYFLYVECEKGENDQFAPTFNCYSPIKYSRFDGKAVKIKGHLFAGGYLKDCVVTAL